MAAVVDSKAAEGSVVYGPFYGNPVTCLETCSCGEEQSGLRGSVLLGHVNGRVLIFSRESGAQEATASGTSDIEEGGGKRSNSFGWKQQRSVLNSKGDSKVVTSILSWKRIKVCSILDEKISGLHCDGSDCFVSVGNRRVLKITLKNKSSVMTFPFASNARQYRSYYESYTLQHKKKVLCTRSNLPSFFINLSNQVEVEISPDVLHYNGTALVAAFDGKKIAIVDTPQDEYAGDEVFVTVQELPTEPPFARPADDNDSSGECDGLTISYRDGRAPWGYQFLYDKVNDEEPSLICIVEMDRTVTIYRTGTYEEAYPPLSLDSRIICFCVVRTGIVFLCRDNTARIWKAGAIYKTIRIPAALSTNHSFAMGYPYQCTFDPINSNLFYNDDNYLYQVAIDSDFPKSVSVTDDAEGSNEK